MMNTRKYSEVNINTNGYDKAYRNPLSMNFQNEYALYETISDLFESVKCRSLCLESLKLYFKELSHSSDNEEANKARKRKTQEGLLSEMSLLVSRDLIGHITFPMMNICRAEVVISTEADGTHTFLFTDGIYGFNVHLDMPSKKHDMKIVIKDIISPDKTTKLASDEAALEGAA